MTLEQFFATALVSAVRFSAIYWAVLPAAIVLELASPRLPRQPMARLKGLAFSIVYLVVVGVIMAAEQVLIWPLVPSQPLFHLQLDASAWSLPVVLVLAPLGAALVNDFFQYWTHRIQHATFLWRFHSVHHSIRDLNAANSFNHWTDEIVKLALIAIPMTLLFRLDLAPAFPAFAVIVALQSYYIHSPVRPHFGPLSRFFVDNRMHRIHHSIEPQHYDKNFGTFTTIWDQIFGTAHFPSQTEWPETGIKGRDETGSVAAYLTARASLVRQQDVEVLVVPEPGTRPAVHLLEGLEIVKSGLRGG